MKHKSYVFFVLVLFLSACSGGGFLGSGLKLTDVGPGTCPQVGILNDARYVTIFSDPKKPRQSNITSEAVINDFDGGCEYKSDKVMVDLDLFLATYAGPKARVRAGDKATVILPYFIAISSSDDEVVAKEVFAAVVKFAGDENEKQQVERLRQVIPLPDVNLGPGYKIYAGFQLSQAQLDYNRKNLKRWEPRFEDPRPQF